MHDRYPYDEVRERLRDRRRVLRAAWKALDSLINDLGPHPKAEQFINEALDLREAYLHQYGGNAHGEITDGDNILTPDSHDITD